MESNSQSDDAAPAPQALAYVVDDEEVIATTLAMILSKSGFEAKAFTQPLEALRAAELRCPDFLVTDVAMPVMHGIDLAIQFRPILNRRVFIHSRKERYRCWADSDRS